jgi:tetratricopeptide (TPR) repeat protein
MRPLRTRWRLSPAEIAREIRRGIDFLAAELRDLPERQRSLRAVYNHSWQLLSEREREVFEETSVFRGSFSREAAQQVAGASLRELMSLVNRSLLQRTPTGRYEVHELSRQYAAEQLRRVPGASQAAGDRHCAYYMGRMQQWGKDLRGKRQEMALTQIGVEMDNVRAAWRWAQQRGQATRLEGAVEGLCVFHEWYRRQAELVAVFRVTVAELERRVEAGRASADELRLLTKILAWGGYFVVAPEPELYGWSARSLEILEQPELAGQDLRAMEVVALVGTVFFEFHYDPEKARHLYERSLALCRALGDPWLTATTLNVWGSLVWGIGAYDEARQALEECLSLCQALGDRKGEAAALFHSTTVALQQERFEEAERCARENVALKQAIGGGDPNAGLRLQSRAVACLGRFGEARTLAEQVVALLRDIGVADWVRSNSLDLGHVEAHRGRYEQARALAQAALDYYRRMGNEAGAGASLVLRGIAGLGLQSGEEAQRDLERGLSNLRVDIPFSLWTWPLPRGLASVHAVLGYAERAGGALGQATQSFCQALRLAAQGRASLPVVIALPGTALLLADRGEVTRAVELYALACRHPFVANSCWFEDVAGRYIAAAMASLPPEEVGAAQERGRGRDLWATAEELLEELGA